MSKYPYFAKKGRPSKKEVELCNKINHYINSGEITEDEINAIIETDGSPTNYDELQDFYSYLTGEVPKSKKKYYTGGIEKELENDSNSSEEFSSASGSDDINEDLDLKSIKTNADDVDAVGFDPFSEPVIERAYTQGINNISNEQENSEGEDDSILEDSDFERPEGGENVADELNSNGSSDGIEDAEIEEDIPEPEWSNSYNEIDDEDEDDDEDYEDEDEDGGKLGDGNLDDLSPAQKRKSAEKTADAILQMYGQFAPLPFKKWASFNPNKIQKMVLNGQLDLNMQLENGVTVKDYIDGTNEQVEEIFEVSEETKQEIKDPLVDVLLEQEIALTPTQRLLLAVGSHVVQMGFSAYQLSQNNKMALESFEKFHAQMRKTNEPTQSRPNPQPTTNVNVSEDRMTETDREAVEELMRELNDDDDEIIDAEHDPSVEVSEGYDDED